MTESTHTAGHSVENRPITLHLFNAGQNTALDTLFIGVFHGDEGISGQLLERFVETLETQIPVGIVPVLNPDGLAKDNRVNTNGVDLNRNFPTENWSAEHEEAAYFPGESPASEPETQVVIELIKKHQPQKIITVHSPYKIINFDGPAEALANTMGKESGYKVVSHIGYPTPGSFGSYAGIERKIPTITLELPEDEEFEAVWNDNKNALMAAINTPIATKPIQ